MTPLVQLCVVLVTVAFVALAVATILALFRLGKAAQVSMAHLEEIAQETRELLAAVRVMVPPAQRVVSRFQRLGERAADLSTALLDEVEPPVLAAVALARGVKTGTSRLLDLLGRRFAPTSHSNNGDHDDE